ncbi:putative pyruvate/indole-pyruvate carboxylase [Lotmaria passim]
MPAQEYNVGCYLLDRLVEIGCGHLFGVPGDYNLRFLDDVTAQQGLEWVGCANELNAAYAADGYARCRRIAAVLTTYGVGELSAMNGIAGACSESCPVIHIVGGPSVKAERARLVLHHTLGDGDFEHFVRMASEVSCAVCHLNDTNALTEIDRVIAACLHHKKPGYILLPLDVALVPCAAPSAPLSRLEVPRSASILAAFKAAVDKSFQTSKAPAALSGHFCDRFECCKEAQALVDDAHIPFASIMFGKGVLNEQSPNFIGTYYGKPSLEHVRGSIEDADVLVKLGVRFHDFGTGFFSQKIEESHCVDIQPFESSVAGVVYSPLPMKDAILAVHEIAMKYCDNWPRNELKPPRFPAPENDHFSMRHFWNEIQDNLMEGDIVVVDQGTSSCCTAGLVLPKNGTMIIQNMWGSIGFSLPAAFGAQLAEPNRRVILVVGDGSAQMTVQELGSFLRHGLHPIVFLVNNDGYVIERVIHGWNEAYNDIASWDWCMVMKGICNGKAASVEVLKDVNMTAKLLTSHAAPVKELVFCEVMLGRHELPIVSLASW